MNEAEEYLNTANIYVAHFLSRRLRNVSNVISPDQLTQLPQSPLNDNPRHQAAEIPSPVEQIAINVDTTASTLSTNNSVRHQPLEYNRTPDISFQQPQSPMSRKLINVRNKRLPINETVANESTWLEESMVREVSSSVGRRALFNDFAPDPNEPIIASSRQNLEIIPQNEAHSDAGFARMFPELSELSLAPSRPIVDQITRNQSAPSQVTRKPSQRPLTRDLVSKQPKPPVCVYPTQLSTASRTTRAITPKPVAQTNKSSNLTTTRCSPIFRKFRDLPEITRMNESDDGWDLQNTDVSVRNNRESTQPRSTPVQPILIRKKDDIPAEQLARNEIILAEQSLLNNKLFDLTSEQVEAMSLIQQREVLDAFWNGTPAEKFKESYPFIAEGVVQKDCEMNKLKVFSARLGKVLIPDSAERMNNDYVYFIVLREGEYCGYFFHPHASNLISAKFPSENRIVIRGYAMMAHAVGKHSNRMTEGKWICWNDQLGMMQIISGAARTSLKKQPIWDKQLDIVSIHASFENHRFVVTKLDALTNVGEQKSHFPDDVFMANDAVFRNNNGDDLVFQSQSLDILIMLKNHLAGDINVESGRQYEIVAAPTFVQSTQRTYRGILLIESDAFWVEKKLWIRERLRANMKKYQDDALARRST